MGGAPMPSDEFCNLNENLTRLDLSGKPVQPTVRRIYARTANNVELPKVRWAGEDFALEQSSAKQRSGMRTSVLVGHDLPADIHYEHVNVAHSNRQHFTFKEVIKL